MNKSILLVVAMALVLAGCTSGNKPRRQSMTPYQHDSRHTKSTNDNAVTPLSTEKFKLKVMNYELHPDKWVFEGHRPAVVDFYATWCRPCKMMAPVMEQMAEKYKGKIDFYKVDIDQEEELAAAFGIQSIPTLLFIPAKGTPAVQTGAIPQAELEKALQALLKK